MWLSASQAGERNLGQEEEQDQELRRQKRIHGPSRSRRAINKNGKMLVVVYFLFWRIAPHSIRPRCRCRMGMQAHHLSAERAHTRGRAAR